MFRCDPPLPGDKTRRRGPVLDPEFWINVLEMFAHRRRRDFKNGCDVAI
jgi:hypothetical protein